MSILIGLGHRSGHGKDLTADFMIEWFEYYRPELKVIKQPWAAKLKDVCHQLYKHLGLQNMEFYDTEEGRHLRNIKLPKINLTPVEIWIAMGTPAVRENVWDKTWISYVRNIKADIIICPDTRFPNETAVCDYTIKVINPRVEDRKGSSVDDVLATFDDWTYYIVNSGDKNKLQGEANAVCYAIEKGI